jgi:hypothetical protein
MDDAVVVGVVGVVGAVADGMDCDGDIERERGVDAERTAATFNSGIDKEDNDDADGDEAEESVSMRLVGSRCEYDDEDEDEWVSVVVAVDAEERACFEVVKRAAGVRFSLGTALRTRP